MRWIQEKFFKMRFLAFLTTIVLFSNFAFCVEKENKTDASMSNSDAFVLGLVEGVTEFLPVSSTGHLILANKFLHLDSEAPLTDAKGNVIYSDKIEDGKPVAYTMKAATDAYAIIIQIAAIAAVAFLYWRDFLSMILGVFGKSKSGFMLARNIVVAFIPAAVIGFLFHDLIEKYLFGAMPVIAALALGALVMIFFQRKYESSFKSDKPALELHNLTLKQSLIVGFMQCVALFPGTSRSMMTILGAYFVGLRPVEAAKFSFILGFVTLSAASVYKLLKDGQMMLEVLSTGPLVLGLVIAFISSLLAAKWLVGFLNKKGLIPFAIYRLVLAAILLILFL